MDALIDSKSASWGELTWESFGERRICANGTWNDRGGDSDIFPWLSENLSRTRTDSARGSNLMGSKPAQGIELRSSLQPRLRYAPRRAQ